MNWKDWLHIPHGDKIAIISLVILIIIALSTHLILNLQPKEEFTFTTPDDYIEWQSQLNQKKEQEHEDYLENRTKYARPYQPKMKKGQTIELNSADTTQLKMIPGIGSGYANRIVNYRTKLGGFIKIEQLEEVWGMDTYLYSQVILFLTLEPKCDSIYINKDSFQKLIQHPYLNYKQVLVIEDIRTRKGSIKSLNRLKLLDEFKRKDIERLKDYISFEE